MYETDLWSRRGTTSKLFFWNFQIKSDNLGSLYYLRTTSQNARASQPPLGKELRGTIRVSATLRES